MIGKIDWSERRVFVVGGGISGLSAAWRLAELGFEVELHERAERWGGLIQTFSTQHGIVESALHSWLETAQIGRMLDTLGVERVSVRRASRVRFVFRDGAMRRVPLYLGELLGLVLRLLSAPGRSVSKPPEQQTLEDWGMRFLGPSGVKYLLNPMVRGIYAARPSELGLFIFAKSKREGRRRMVATKGGSQDLVNALVDKLTAHRNVKLHLGSQVNQLPLSTNVLLAGSSASSAALLEQRSPEGARLLHQIQYLPLITVTVFVEEPTRGKRGVGVLFPECETGKTLGVLFSSDSFSGRVKDERRVSSFTCILGGSSQLEVMAETDEQIDARVFQDLEKVLGHKPRILDRKIQRWPQALPLYSPDLKVIWAGLQRELEKTPGTALFGNYTGQISARGIWQQLATWPLVESPSE